MVGLAFQFSEQIQKLKVNLSISGRTQSTFLNYSRLLAAMALHFKCLPTALFESQINDYLYFLQQQHNTPSETYFKHTIYGLRALFKVENISADHIKLPKIKRSKKLPVVLSKSEMKRLLLAPNLLKHRILIGLLYGCGLRCFEARNVQLSDLDFERAALHVRQGRGGKDRYVPLSQHLIRGLKHYIQTENPNNGFSMDNHRLIGLQHPFGAVTSTGDIANEAYNGQLLKQSKRQASQRTLAYIPCDIPTQLTYLKMDLTS